MYACIKFGGDKYDGAEEGVMESDGEGVSLDCHPEGGDIFNKELNGVAECAWGHVGPRVPGGESSERKGPDAEMWFCC